MIGVHWIYWLAGAFFASTGALIAFDAQHPRRATSAAFWLLLGICFIAADVRTMPAWLIGIGVIAMALLAGTGHVVARRVAGGRPSAPASEPRPDARREGNLVFAPALTIPAVTIIIATAAKGITLHGQPVLARGQETLIGLGVAVIVALGLAVGLFCPRRPQLALCEGRRLLESVGWAVLLPQMLTVLGGLFTQAGVGGAVGLLFQHVVPDQSRDAAVFVYAAGMALFTLVMGNAFAAFPIMTAAVGWPILVQRWGAHPAPLFAIGMLAGYCGTLCTPMAANFNLVPPALLDMRDRYGQIKVQVPTALALFAVNCLLLLSVPFA